jgi:hypothetical protein
MAYYVSVLLAAVAVVAALALFGPSSCSCSQVDCGPGTHLEADLCVPDDNAGNGTGNGGSVTTPSSTEGTEGTDGGTSPRTFEVCPTGAP